MPEDKVFSKSLRYFICYSQFWWSKSLFSRLLRCFICFVLPFSDQTRHFSLFRCFICFLFLWSKFALFYISSEWSFYFRGYWGVLFVICYMLLRHFMCCFTFQMITGLICMLTRYLLVILHFLMLLPFVDHMCKNLSRVWHA